jgi:hypothetical protein
VRAADQARDWTVAIAAAAGALLLVALAMRLPVKITTPEFPGLDPHRSETPLRVRWSGIHREVEKLVDPRFLFLPTSLSVVSNPHLGSGIADKFPALTSPSDLTFQPRDLRLEKLPPPVKMPSDPAAALEANPPGNLAMGMGRVDQTPPRLEARQAWVEVVAPSTGKVLLRQTLPVGALPDFPASDWGPAFFSATVNASGLVGSVVPMPAPTASEPFASLDSDSQEQLANFLEAKMFLGQRLPPGFYRISVGP